MSRPGTPSDLRALVAIDAVTVVGIIVFHLLFGPVVPVAVQVVEAGGIGLIGLTCAIFWWKRVSRVSASAAPAGDLDVLRKESAENLRVLQQDLHNLGSAMLKRLAQKSDATSESEQLAALAGTLSDLAVSLAESRESLAAVAADIGEVKSAVFEVQAQVDQQADALRAFEHGLARLGHAGVSGGCGDGAAPGSLGRALGAGVSGSAVARLIGNGCTKKDPDAGADVAPLASTDIEGAYESEGQEIPGQDFAVDEGITTTDWPEPYFDKTPDLSLPASPTPESLAQSPETGDDEFGEEESADMDFGDDDRPEGAKPIAPSQPDLLAIDDGETRTKPRRPGRRDTALVAHVMIGIGSKPYLRGHGPGLSPVKGVPMEYVDVGRWQWVCPEAGSPVTVTVWKNDEIPAAGDAVGIPSGVTLEIHPQFGH